MTLLLLLWACLTDARLLVESYTNPVIVPNSPDPGCILVEGIYTCVTTSNLGIADGIFPIQQSVDLVHWKHMGYVFAKATTWAVQDFWAPEIHNINGVYYLYYTARDSTGLLCIGVARSKKGVTGPFVSSKLPLARDPAGKMGYIDATYFEGMLVWKHDGNAVNLPTPIVAQQLTSPMVLNATFTPVQLITNNLSWEGPLVEGPWLFRHQHSLYLFYSANGYDKVNANGTCVYAMGVARAKQGDILGGFDKNPLPVISTSVLPAPLTGPGHCSVIRGPDYDTNNTTYAIYHAWSFGAVGGNNSRHMLVDRVDWRPSKGGWPVIDPLQPGTPSSSPRPLPQ